MNGITVTIDYYSTWCKGFNYGSKVLELHPNIIDAIDNFFDGLTDPINPDEFWVNKLQTSDEEPGDGYIIFGENNGVWYYV